MTVMARRNGIPGHDQEIRALTVALLGAAGVSVLILLLSLTPVAQAVASWPLD